LKLQVEINQRLFELPEKADRITQPARPVRKAPPPPPGARQSAEESGIRVGDSMVEGIEDLGEGADTAETAPPQPPTDVDENAPTNVYPGSAQVDESAPTRIYQAKSPAVDKPRVLFTSITQMLDLTTSEAQTLQTAELVEGDYASILGKLTKKAEVLNARVSELQTEVQTLRAEKEKLPGQILDALEQHFPSLAKQVKALRALLINT